MKTMTRPSTRQVIGGVDTHKDVHVAAVIDSIGRIQGVESFPTTVHSARLAELGRTDFITPNFILRDQVWRLARNE